MSDQELNSHELSDAALAKLFHLNYEKLAPHFGYETREDTREFDPESKNGQLMIAVAHEINQTVIKPTANAAAAYMVKNMHKALYEALPEGEVSAFDLLEVINQHMANLLAAIKVLNAADGEVVEEQSA